MDDVTFLKVSHGMSILAFSLNKEWAFEVNLPKFLAAQSPSSLWAPVSDSFQMKLNQKMHSISAPSTAQPLTHAQSQLLHLNL